MSERPIAKIEDYQPRLRFPLQAFSTIKVGTSRSYLVKGIIPREGLVVVWGPPKCGKTFWAFDIVMHVALGWEYRGRRVERGAVIYIACEGERGLAARTEAFRRGKMSEEITDNVPFYLITTRLDLVADAAELIRDVQAQIGNTACSALVVDTLNRSIHGSESDDADMGAYVKAADALREAFGCAVIIIHHCGTDGTRPRGHTSLTGAADAQIAVKRDADGVVTTNVEWMKDGPEGAETRSTLEVVEVGTDEDREPITSCVVIAIDAAGIAKRRGTKVTGPAKVTLDLLRKAIDEAGEDAPASTHIPAGARVVSVDVWRGYAYQGSVSESEKPAAQRKAFARAVAKLQALGAVGIWSKWAWLIDR
jgi:hypothetical protein